MKLIIKKIGKNFYWKLLSVFFALILWFIAINDTNMVVTEEYNVPITLLNENYLDSAGYILANKKELEAKFIKVYIRTNRSDKKQLDMNPKAIIASVDLKAIDIASSKKLGSSITTSVKFQIPSLSSAKLVSTSISVVDIVLDKYKKREMEIDVKTTNKVSNGYETLKSITDPKTVIVSGPESIVDKIAQIRVDVDLNQATSDIVLEKTPIAYDIEDVVISDQININNENIQVTIPVRKSEKILINKPIYSGKVKDGYIISDFDYEPKVIQVLGTIDEINEFKSITLDPIDVTGFSETQVITLDLRKYLLSTNLSILNGTPNEVKVIIGIEKEEILEFEIPNSQIQTKGTADEITINDTSFKVTLKATGKLFKSLDKTTLKCLVDLTALEVGTHDVPVDISLPPNFILVGEIPTINITISKTDIDTQPPEDVLN